MNVLPHTASVVHENISGANGDLSWEEQIESAAQRLADYVYEAMVVQGFDYGAVIDINAYLEIQRLVAIGMIAQHKHDAEMWGVIYPEPRDRSQQARPRAD